jgi:hypothetical protein
MSGPSLACVGTESIAVFFKLLNKRSYGGIGTIANLRFSFQFACTDLQRFLESIQVSSGVYTCFLQYVQTLCGFAESLDLIQSYPHRDDFGVFAKIRFLDDGRIENCLSFSDIGLRAVQNVKIVDFDYEDRLLFTVCLATSQPSVHHKLSALVNDRKEYVFNFNFILELYVLSSKPSPLYSFPYSFPLFSDDLAKASLKFDPSLYELRRENCYVVENWSFCRRTSMSTGVDLVFEDFSEKYPNGLV